MMLWRRWMKSKEGHAGMEAVLIFPVLLTLLLGVFDAGNAILANQKTIRASQVTADLVTRAREVTHGDVSEAVDAGRLALTPLATSEYGVDIVSVRFDGDAIPQIVWRETRNMDPVADVLGNLDLLARPGEGVVIVTSKYNFDPVFASPITGPVAMREVAFARGRLSAVVCREGVPLC